MKIEEIQPTPTLILKSVSTIPADISELVFAYSDNLTQSYATGKKVGAITAIPLEKNKVRVFVSIGESKNSRADVFRKAAASFARWCNSHALNTISLDINQPTMNSDKIVVRAALEGLCIGGFEFSRYKTTDKKAVTVTTILVADVNDQTVDQEINRAAIIGESVDLARDWIHEPANSINPQILEERAHLLAKEHGLAFKTIQYDELVAMGAGGIAAVGRGSQTKPRLILVEYKGNGSNSSIVLVGKAITFDTGGYSLKGTEFIQGMKNDKAGGVSVLAAVIAAARLKLKVNLVAVIPTAENMISGEAYRPDDILTLLSGLTVEITTTDAEGRLILADALSYAQKQYKPGNIIDIATLTGGVKVALGTERAGLLSNSDHLADILYTAGETTGEKVWRLPMDEEYFDLLKSDEADMKNAGPREAQTIVGAIFLKQAIINETPWAHLDIAATGEMESEKSWSPKGANGFGVRLMLETVEKLM